MRYKSFQISATAQSAAVGGVSVSFGTPLAANKVYSLCCNVDVWFKQGFGPQTAVAGAAGNVMCPASVIHFIHGSHGDTLAVIKDGATGMASLSQIAEI